MRSEDTIAACLDGYMAYTVAGSGIAGFCDGTLQNCTLAKPSSIVYDPSRQAFFILDQQLTHGVRVITKDLGVHTISWQPDCTLRAPHGLAILNNILLIADTGNGSVKYLLLTNYFKINYKRSIIQFCSSTCGSLRTLSLNVTQPVAILPYSPSSFLVLDSIQRSVRLVLLDIFLEQPSGELLLAVQAVETLYVGILRVPSNMIDLYGRKYLLVSDKSTLVAISIETKRGVRLRFKCYSFSVSQSNRIKNESTDKIYGGSGSKLASLQSYPSELKHISGISAYQLSSTQEIILLADDQTHMIYYTVLNLQTLLDSLITKGTLEEPTSDCWIDVYQLTNSMRRCGYKNGTLLNAEFSNPQGTLTVKLDGQLCVFICDTGNSVIRLIGPDFLKQEKEQPVYLQVQADNHDLILGKVRAKVDRHFLALRRALQRVKTISISNAVIRDVEKETQAPPSSFPLAPPLLGKKHEHNKKILHHYLARANIALAVDGNTHLDPCQLEDIDSSDTPSLASEDPLTTELVSIEKATKDTLQMDRKRQQLSAYKIVRPASRRISYTDASVQHESEGMRITTDRSTQVLSEPDGLSELNYDHNHDLDSFVLESATLSQGSLISEEEASKELPPCYTNNGTRWEFQIIRRVWFAINEADIDGALVQKLDSLMDENHLFDIHQQVLELSTMLLAHKNNRLVESLLRLAFLFFKRLSCLGRYINFYQSLPFPKKFKPSIKCLMLLQRILTNQLVQLSDITITEILLPLAAQHWFSATSANINYLSLLGLGNGWSMILAIQLISRDKPVPLLKPPESRLGIYTSGDALLSAFAIDPDTDFTTLNLALSITAIVVDTQLEGRQILVKIGDEAGIVALENCRLKIIHNQEPCKPVLYSNLYIQLTSIAELTLKISCAELSIRTPIPVKLISTLESADTTADGASDSHAVPVWLIDLMKYTLIISQ